MTATNANAPRDATPTEESIAVQVIKFMESREWHALTVKFRPKNDFYGWIIVNVPMRSRPAKREAFVRLAEIMEAIGYQTHEIDFRPPLQSRSPITLNLAFQEETIEFWIDDEMFAVRPTLEALKERVEFVQERRMNQ